MNPLALSAMRYTTDPRVDTGAGFLLDQDPHAHVAPQIIEFLRKRSGPKVLDLGCGTGGYSYRLRELGFEVTAVDRNPSYVARARSLGLNAEEAPGEKLPFADDSFDTVVLVEVLEHIPDEAIPALLEEVRRVARNNALLTVPDCTQHGELVAEEFMHGHFRAVDHVQFFTADSLSALLREFFPQAAVARGDPLFPHRLLPRVVRRPLSLFYRLGWLRPTLYSRLYAEARKNA